MTNLRPVQKEQPMFGIHSRKSLGIVVSLMFAVLVFTVFVLPRVNPPAPAVHSYLISAGGVSRCITTSRSARTGRPGRLSPPYQPHHIDFTSSNGPVDVYVVRISSSDPGNEVTRMMEMTERLQAGQPPENLIAKGSGEKGRIDVAGFWPYGWARSLVLIRSQNESEVQLVVHYGPNSKGPPAAAAAAAVE